MSDLHARRLIVALLLAAVLLAALLAKPFWQALFLAAVLAAALQRPTGALSLRLGGRRGVASAIVTVALIAVVVLPVATLGAMLVGQVADGIGWLRQTIQGEGVWGLVERLPVAAQHAISRVLAKLPEPQQELQALAGQGGQAAAVVGGFIAATGSALFQTVMMLIALFFFLEDGPRLVRWIDAAVPLRPGQFRALMEDFRQTSVSVLLATGGTALIQSAAAFVGYAIARAPKPVFLTLTTFVFALIPAAGATIVVLAAGGLLLATGHTLAGIFLLIWGVAVVALVDNLARPFLLKGGMELHGGLVFFALLGGLAAFGAIGLVVGPLVLTFLVTALKMYRREFGQPGEAPGSEPEP